MSKPLGDKPACARMIVLLCLSTLMASCSASLASDDESVPNRTAKEVLECHENLMRSAPPLKMELQAETRGVGNRLGSADRGRNREQVSIRRNQNLIDIQGRSCIVDGKGTVLTNSVYPIRQRMIGSLYAEERPGPTGTPVVFMDRNAPVKKLVFYSYSGGMLDGNFYGSDNQGVVELLQNSDTLEIVPDPAHQNLFHIQGRSKFGLAEGWFDPKKRCMLVGYRITKGPQDLFEQSKLMNAPGPKDVPATVGWQAELSDVETVEVDGFPIVSSGAATLTLVDAAGDKNAIIYSFKRSEIQVDTETDALANLDTFVSEGIEVHLKQHPGIKSAYVNHAVRLMVDQNPDAKRRLFLTAFNPSKLGRRTCKDLADANAAFFYARGTKAILEIPDDAWNILIQAKPEANEAANVDRRWREQLDSALQEFREGSSYVICDWSALRQDNDGMSNSIHIAPAYIAGIWRAVEYLNALSMRESSAKDYPRSAADIATAVRLVMHLARDNVMASSCASHELIHKLKPLLERFALDGQMPPDDFEQIRAAVWLLHPKDPCGYWKSGQATRKDLANFFAEKFPEAKAAGDPVLDIGSFVRTLKAGQLVSGLMLADKSTKEAKIGESANEFAGHTAPISRDLFIRIVGTKNWEESKDFAATELSLLKNATGKEPLKIEPPLALDVTARYKQAPEEIQQLRSLFSQRKEKQASQSIPE